MSIPTDFGGLQFWFAADRITGLVDTNPVATWPDLTGLGGRDAVQAVGANQPLFRTGILNGLPVVRFDGVNDNMKTPSSVAMGPCTIIVLAKVIADIAAIDVSLWGHTDDVTIAREILRRDVDGALRSVVLRVPGLSEYRVSQANFNLLDGAFHALALTYGGTHATHIPLRSGQQFPNIFVNSAVEPGAAVDTVLFSMGTVAAQFANVDIAEAFGYGVVKSVFELNALFQYLRNKWATANATTSASWIAGAVGGGGAPGPGANIIVAVPPGTVNGMMMLATTNVNETSTGEPVFTVPGGWTEIGTKQKNGRVILRSWVRIANAEPANYTWTFAPALDQGATITIDTFTRIRANVNAITRISTPIGLQAAPTVAWGTSFNPRVLGISALRTACDGLVGGTPTWTWDRNTDIASTNTPDVSATNEASWVRGGGAGDALATALVPNIAKYGFSSVFHMDALESPVGIASKIKRLRHG